MNATLAKINVFKENFSNNIRGQMSTHAIPCRANVLTCQFSKRGKCPGGGGEHLSVHRLFFQLWLKNYC